MKIKVNYIETPIEDISVKRARAGAIGGKARVPKGFAMMDKEKLRAVSRKGVESRRGKK